MVHIEIWWTLANPLLRRCNNYSIDPRCSRDVNNPPDITGTTNLLFFDFNFAPFRSTFVFFLFDISLRYVSSTKECTFVFSRPKNVIVIAGALASILFYLLLRSSFILLSSLIFHESRLFDGSYGTVVSDLQVTRWNIDFWRLQKQRCFNGVFCWALIRVRTRVTRF